MIVQSGMDDDVWPPFFFGCPPVVVEEEGVGG